MIAPTPGKRPFASATTVSFLYLSDVHARAFGEFIAPYKE